MYEGEIKDQGDTVFIRTTPDITIRDHRKGQVLVNQQPESAPVTLLIDKGKYWAFATNKVDDAQTDIKNYAETWTDDAAEQLKIEIDTDVLARVPADVDSANKGASAGKISGDIDLGVDGGVAVALTKANVLEKIVDMGQVLNEQNVPQNGRWIVIPAFMAGLIMKSDLKDASLAGDGTSILRNGRLGMIAEFMVFMSNNLSTGTDSGSATTTNVLFGTTHGLTFASQLLNNESLPNPNAFGTLFRGLQVFGDKVIKPEAIGVMSAKKG